jgi:hypothetical protein
MAFNFSQKTLELFDNEKKYETKIYNLLFSFFKIDSYQEYIILSLTEREIIEKFYNFSKSKSFTSEYYCLIDFKTESKESTFINLFNIYKAFRKNDKDFDKTLFLLDDFFIQNLQEVSEKNYWYLRLFRNTVMNLNIYNFYEIVNYVDRFIIKRYEDIEIMSLNRDKENLETCSSPNLFAIIKRKFPNWREDKEVLEILFNNIPYKIEEENLQFLEECLEVCDLLKEYETKKDLLFQKLRIEGFKKETFKEIFTILKANKEKHENQKERMIEIVFDCIFNTNDEYFKNDMNDDSLYYLLLKSYFED